MKNLEHISQCEVVEYCRLSKKYPELNQIFSIPNEAKRSLRLGAKLKASGLRSGVPDLQLSIAKNGYFGLFIEMKTSKGVISDNQKIVIAELRRQNYLVEICYSAEEAINTLEKYIQSENTLEYYKRVFSTKS